MGPVAVVAAGVVTVGGVAIIASQSNDNHI